MAENFVKFQQFVTEEELLDFTDFLKEHNVKFKVEDNTPALDVNVAFNPDPLQKSFLVKLQKTDFPKVKALLTKQAEELVAEVNDDHYLFSFSNQELVELIKKADEWNPFDVQLAKKILADEGIEIHEEAMKKIEKERIEELAKPKKITTTWIVLAYILGTFGWLFGLLLAWYLTSSKITLPDGNRVFFFDENARKHGKWIKIIATIHFIIGIAYVFLK